MVRKEGGGRRRKRGGKGKLRGEKDIRKRGKIKGEKSIGKCEVGKMEQNRVVKGRRN